MSDRKQRPGRRSDIKVGSVWISRDPRDHGRQITIEGVAGDFGNGYVVARSARRSTLRVSTLLERYDLLREAS